MYVDDLIHPQKIATWFKNERQFRKNKRKEVQKPSTTNGGDNSGDDDDEIPGHLWRKRWTKRTAAGYLFKEEVEREMKRLVESGEFTQMTAYQPALTTVWNDLPVDEQIRCKMGAEKFNTSVWPRDLQIE